MDQTSIDALDAYEIEGHGLYWEVNATDGTFVATIDSEADLDARFPGIRKHTHADWLATLCSECGDEDATEFGFSDGTTRRLCRGCAPRFGRRAV